MLLLVLSFIFKAIYLVLPLAALIVAVHWHERWRGIGGALIVAMVAGFAVALALNLVYAKAVHGRITVSQLAIAGYFACAMFLLLRLTDQGLRWLLHRMLGLHRPEFTSLRALRALLFAVARVGLLFALGVPYVMASVMIYRPKVASSADPQSQLGFTFQPAEFRTADGVKIAAWWIPAQHPSQQSSSDTNDDEQQGDGQRDDAQWGTQTALVCPGMNANKSTQLHLARDLVPGGYNCLILDFRAHGDSGGQLTTFGAREKLDVLAAVRWLQANHPQQCRRIVGVGASTGAAALISAAADDSPQGRSIAAVAAYACYDDFWDIAAETTDQYFAPPLDWLLLHVGIPIASAETGADLVHYAPVNEIGALWPRPVLLIQAEHDEIVDFSHGQALLDAASQPKYHVWFTRGHHDAILKSDVAARIVLEFFRAAKTLPVI